MGYSRKEIIGITPLDYKNMNDNFKYLWLKTFGNIVDADLASNANINGTKIKAKTITADQIDVTTLYVGTGGIAMDPSATISWGQISNPPPLDSYTDAEALNAWASSGYATHIDANGIYTGALTALQITALGTIQGLHFQTAGNNVKRFVADGSDFGIFGTDNLGKLTMQLDPSGYPILYFGSATGSIQSAGTLWITAPDVKVGTTTSNAATVLTTASTITAKFA